MGAHELKKLSAQMSHLSKHYNIPLKNFMVDVICTIYFVFDIVFMAKDKSPV